MTTLGLNLTSEKLITSAILGTVSAAAGFYLARLSPQTHGVQDSATHIPDEPEVQEDDSGDIPDGDLAAVSAGFLEPCKMVLIVRNDLKMPPGTVSTHCGEATLRCFKALSKNNPQLVRHWERTGQAKIALKGTSEDQLLELEAIAKSLNLCARSVHDKLSSKAASF
ncbi:hypothetical protein V5O48_002221 [Marasmius crinis-equi]|uniref:peptidyl-tRNA hydrolase n=1 Tax=Marasmius crinis-equi TaxID=585013 RepID=A0ABR3FWB9_9AGAR